MERTREPQYQEQVVLRDQQGLTRLGLVTNQVYRDDPRRLVFILARYKFVARMLKGHGRVLEVGCGDAFGSRIVRQEVDSLHTVDFDPVFIDDIESRREECWAFTSAVHDIVRGGPVPGGPFDAAYAIDFIEHVEPRDEDVCVSNIVRSLASDGVLILGTPSLHSQAHASPASKAGHVNCKTEDGLRTFLQRHFGHVFVFSMNDEVVHTGFGAMAHYYMALCCGPHGHGTQTGE